MRCREVLGRYVCGNVILPGLAQKSEGPSLAAEAALADTELRAPFAGVIGRITVEVGEAVNPGTPLISVADQSAWRLETDDLTEIDVVHVRVGQPVTVLVDALPDATFKASVESIRPQGETKRGDVTYTVAIRLAPEHQSDPRLRWGMTAMVEIDVRE